MQKPSRPKQKNLNMKIERLRRGEQQDKDLADGATAKKVSKIFIPLP